MLIADYIVAISVLIVLTLWAGAERFLRPYLPQSSSASRLTAGA